jgi:hypothetical protein
VAFVDHEESLRGFRKNGAYGLNVANICLFSDSYYINP